MIKATIDGKNVIIIADQFVKKGTRYLIVSFSEYEDYMKTHEQVLFGGLFEELEKDEIDPWLKQLKLRPQCEEPLLRDDSVNMVDSKST